MKKKIVKIAGAGPAGLSAAIVLAKNGIPVEVYERQPTVGARFNGDYQGLENWSRDEDVIDELFDLGIQPSFELFPVANGMIYDTNRSSLQVTSNRSLVYLVRRGRMSNTLDSQLAVQAKESGARIIYRSSPLLEEMDILATGPRGVGAIAAGMRFACDEPEGAYAIVGDDIAPGGYAYLLIAAGQATLASVLFKEFQNAQSALRNAVRAFVRLLDIQIVNPVHWGGYGNCEIPRTAIRQSRLYVGEAAGFQDCLFGFGIRIAIVTGCLAAKSILEGRNYDSLWKARFQRQLRTSKTNRLLYELFGEYAYNLLWRLIGTSREPLAFMRLLYNWRIC